MGNLDNAEADDKLDERLWGDEDEDDEEDASSKTEETGPGMDEVKRKGVGRRISKELNSVNSLAQLVVLERENLNISQVLFSVVFFSVGDDVLLLRL